MIRTDILKSMSKGEFAVILGQVQKSDQINSDRSPQITSA